MTRFLLAISFLSLFTGREIINDGGGTGEDDLEDFFLLFFGRSPIKNRAFY